MAQGPLSSRGECHENWGGRLGLNLSLRLGSDNMPSGVKRTPKRRKDKARGSNAAAAAAADEYDASSTCSQADQFLLLLREELLPFKDVASRLEAGQHAMEQQVNELAARISVLEGRPATPPSSAFPPLSSLSARPRSAEARRPVFAERPRSASSLLIWMWLPFRHSWPSMAISSMGGTSA